MSLWKALRFVCDHAPPLFLPLGKSIIFLGPQGYLTQVMFKNTLNEIFQSPLTCRIHLKEQKVIGDPCAVPIIFSGKEGVSDGFDF